MGMVGGSRVEVGSLEGTRGRGREGGREGVHGGNMGLMLHRLFRFFVGFWSWCFQSETTSGRDD